MKKIRSASLKIGKVIHDELSDAITTYPLVAPQNTTYPFAIYKRTSLQVENTKDIFNCHETADIEIVIVSNTYSETIEKAIDVKMYLEHLKGTYSTSMDESINISDITLVDSSEEYNGDAYLQILNFRIDIENDYGEN